eukprot:scaffold112647_cov28-Tisochrysis_lutea.AAC.3
MTSLLLAFVFCCRPGCSLATSAIRSQQSTSTKHLVLSPQLLSPNHRLSVHRQSPNHVRSVTRARPRPSSRLPLPRRWLRLSPPFNHSHSSLRSPQAYHRTVPFRLFVSSHVERQWSRCHARFHADARDTYQLIRTQIRIFQCLKTRFADFGLETRDSNLFA